MKEKLAESSKKLKDRPPVWQHIFFTDTIVGGPFGSSVASPAQAAHSLVAGRPSSSFIYLFMLFTCGYTNNGYGAYGPQGLNKFSEILPLITSRCDKDAWANGYCTEVFPAIVQSFAVGDRGGVCLPQQLWPLLL